MYVFAYCVWVEKDIKPVLNDSEWQYHSAPQENSFNTNTFWRTPEGLQLKIKTGLIPWCRTPVLFILDSITCHKH